MSRDSYTTNEAQKRFCPLSPAQECGCIADDCMAWRWSQSKQTAAYSKAVIEHAIEARKADPKHNISNSYRDVLLDGDFERTEGYCGLAGFPHNALKP